jgi:hypothetical protein
MTLIDQLKQRPIAAAIIAVCLVTAIIMLIVSSRGPSFEPIALKKVFVYDEKTGAESVRMSDEAPPFLNDQGEPTLVRAYYASPDGGKTKVLAFLEKFDDAGKAAYRAYIKNPGGEQGAELARKIDAGRFVRLPKQGAEWVAYDSGEGRAVMANVKMPGGGSMPLVVPELASK